MFCLVSILLRYAILDNLAGTTIMRCALALLPCIRTPVMLGILSCIVDIFDFIIGSTKIILLAAASIAGVLSTGTVATMKKISLRRIYGALAVLGLAILYINIILVAIFVIAVSATAYQDIVSM